MPYITPNVAYRVYPFNSFEIHFKDKSKENGKTSISISAKGVDFKLAGIHAIILGYVSKCVLYKESMDNQAIMRQFYHKILNNKIDILTENINSHDSLQYVISAVLNDHNLDLISKYIGKFDVSTFNTPEIYTESIPKCKTKKEAELNNNFNLDEILKQNVAPSCFDIVYNAIDEYITFKLKNDELEFIETHQQVGLLQEEIVKLKESNEKSTNLYLNTCVIKNKLTTEIEDLKHEIYNLNKQVREQTPIVSQRDVDLEAESKKLREMYISLQEAFALVNDELNSLKLSLYDKFHKEYIELLKVQMEQNIEHNRKIYNILYTVDSSLSNISETIRFAS